MLFQLAALDHNANTGREQATASKEENGGERRYKVVFLKQPREWVAKPIMQKTRDHLKIIVHAMVERMMQDAAERSAVVTALHIPHNQTSLSTPEN